MLVLKELLGFPQKEDLTNKVLQLEADNKRLRSEVDEEILQDVHNSTFVIDWKTMNAFSLERMGWLRQAYTVIGYLQNGETREWKFYCSQEQHESLAKEFKKWISQKG